MVSVQIALLLGLAAIVAARPDGDSRKQFLRQEKAILEKCRKDVNAPKGYVDDIFVKEVVPNSKEGKCFTKCALQSLKWMKPDGSLDAAEIAKLANKAYFTPDQNAKAAGVWKKCFAEQPKTGNDHCELAYKALNCYFTGVKAAGLPRHSQEA